MEETFRRKFLKFKGLIVCLAPSEFFVGIKFSKWMREDFIF